jgi:hypothetical protein
MSDLDEAILTTLGEQPFVSVRQLAAATHLAPSTVYWHLAHKLGFTVRHLCWVPHTLSTLDMERRVACSNQLLNVLNPPTETPYSLYMILSSRTSNSLRLPESLKRKLRSRQ